MPRRRSAKRSVRRSAKRSVRRRSSKRRSARRSAKRSTRRRSARRSACRGWKWPWAFGEMPERYQVGLTPSSNAKRPPLKSTWAQLAEDRAARNEMAEARKREEYKRIRRVLKTSGFS